MELIDRYVDRLGEEDPAKKTHKAKPGLSRYTIARRRQLLMVFDQEIGLQATRDDVEAWIRTQNWSVKTEGDILGHLRQFYAWAVTEGLLKVDPVADIPSPREGNQLAMPPLPKAPKPKKKRRPYGGGFKPRSIRVDDKTWTHAREVAEQNGIGVSEMVVAYLRTLRVKKPTGLPRAQAAALVKAQNGRTTAGKFARPAVGPRSEIIDQKTCPHPQIRELGAATFCRRCGINMDLVK